MPGSLRLLAPILIAGLPLTLAAEPIRVSGQVMEFTGGGLTGARVELFPQTGTAPVATAQTDAAGLFELAAPASGCYRVRIEAAGHLSLENPVLPVTEATSLTPAITLSTSHPRARDAGSQALGGWVFGAPASRAAQPLAAPRLVQGKVSDPQGAPVPGALVWSEGSPAIPCARTGADGAFQIRLPASGGARLRAVAAGYLPTDPREPPPPGAPLALKLAPAGTIAGRVVDAAGRPLAGVQVGALPVRWTEGSPRYATARSREDGRFRLSQLAPGELHAVTASLEGFATATVKADALPRGRRTAPVRIVLERGTTAFGRVLDRENRPVRGAELVLAPAASEVMFSREQLFSGDEAGEVQATSGPEGGFELRHLNPGRFQLQVNHKGFAPFTLPGIEVPPRTARLDLGTLTLDPGLAIEGRVTDPDGAPLPGAEVTLNRSFDSFNAMGLVPPRNATTGADGVFRFDDLRRGDHFDLRVERRGYVPATVPAVEAPAPERLTVELKPGRTLSGRVRGPAGEPVRNAGLSLREETSFQSPLGVSTIMGPRPLGVTDENGKFQAEGVPPGTADLDVSAPGYRFKRLQGIPVPEERDVEGLEITLEKGSVLEIRALDSRGGPVAGARVLARRTDSPAPESRGVFTQCQTDAEGRCRMDDAEPGRYAVSAESKENGHAEAAVEAKAGVNALDLVFPAGVEVSGRVSDEAGAPVPAASLSLQPLERGAAFSAISNADGTFRFRAVADGTFRLSGSAPGFAGTSAPGDVRVAGQEVRGLDLRLSRGATLTGKVLGLEPREMGGVLIFAFRADGAFSYPLTGRVDAEGRYRIEDLGPGDWSVSARAGTRAIQESVQLAPGIRETVLDLQFPAGFTLSGRALVDRAPFSGAQVAATARDRALQGVTGPDGGFQLSNLTPGRYNLMVMDYARGLSATKTIEGHRGPAGHPDDRDRRAPRGDRRRRDRRSGRGRSRPVAESRPGRAQHDPHPRPEERRLRRLRDLPDRRRNVQGHRRERGVRARHGKRRGPPRRRGGGRDRAEAVALKSMSTARLGGRCLPSASSSPKPGRSWRPPRSALPGGRRGFCSGMSSGSPKGG